MAVQLDTRDQMRVAAALERYFRSERLLERTANVLNLLIGKRPCANDFERLIRCRRRKARSRIAPGDAYGKKGKALEAEIAAKLAQAGDLATQGKLQSEIARALGVSVMTLHRWRKMSLAARDAPPSPNALGQLGQATHDGRIAELQLENSRLRRLVTDLLLEKMKLEETFQVGTRREGERLADGRRVRRRSHETKTAGQHPSNHREATSIVAKDSFSPGGRGSRQIIIPFDRRSDRSHREFEPRAEDRYLNSRPATGARTSTDLKSPK